MQNCVCTKSAPASALARRALGSQPAADRSACRPRRARCRSSRRSRSPTAACAAAHAVGDREQRLCCRGRTPVWPRAGRRPSDRRRRASGCCGCRAPRRRGCRPAARADCGRGRSSGRSARCRPEPGSATRRGWRDAPWRPAPSVTFMAVARPLSGSAPAQELGRIGGHRRRNLGGDDEMRRRAASPGGGSPDLIIGIRLLARAARHHRLHRTPARRGSRASRWSACGCSTRSCCAPPCRRSRAADGKHGPRRASGSASASCIALEGELFLVVHLMIAGRLHWMAPARSRRADRAGAASSSTSGTLSLTEAGTQAARVAASRRRAQRRSPRSIPAASTCSTCDLATFAARLVAREPHAQARADRSAPVQRHRQRLLRRDPAPRRAVADRADHERSTDDEVARLFDGDARDAARMDRAAARARPATASREGHRLPPGDGGARPLRQALPGVRRAGAAHRLRRERDQLLRALPDRRTLLADRALSRLLKESWPRSIDELG